MKIARSALRIGVGVVVFGGAVGAMVVIGAGLMLHASLPQLDGVRSLPRLGNEVTVDRDDQGVPTIRGSSRADVALALGFVHAQERFFQMDLQRRRAAGEMAELFGRQAASWDARVRAHRLAAVADRVVDHLSPEDRRILEAYTVGVNEGLDGLQESPFEYLLLRSRPRPWDIRDSVLCLLSMFLQLNPWGGEREMAISALAEVLPPELFELLACPGSQWDAPLDRTVFEQPPIPGPEVIDLRQGSGGGDGVMIEDQDPVGSNAWAVAGSRTPDGRAILACDMHLGLMVPNIWFRARLMWPEGEWDGEELDITGVTLPGMPFVVAGSNRRIAWGFTNSYGDWVDVLAVEPEALGALQQWQERISVAGGDDLEVDLQSTDQGPVVGRDAQGRWLVLRWTAHRSEAVNPAFRRLEIARSVDEAVLAGASMGIPPQNLMVADRDGRIGWTIAGRIPKKSNCSDESGTTVCDWQGWLEAAAYPAVKDPPDGIVWTANARVVGGEEYHLIGDGGFALGARAQQIRDALIGLQTSTEGDMLAIQLDDRAVFLEWWRERLLEALSDERTQPSVERTELEQLVENWSGRASVDDSGFRCVRAFRLYVRGLVLDPLVSGCDEVAGPCGWEHLGQREAAVRRLLTEKPVHLLDPRFETWYDLLIFAADRVINDFSGETTSLADHPWGERNMVRLRHPLSSALPEWLAQRVDMSPIPLPGDSHMPRVQTPSFGASERFVVSPGREENAVFHMPGGQSGHPLSPYYAAGHDDWVQGAPSAFLPGETTHRLQLRPQNGS